MPDILNKDLNYQSNFMDAESIQLEKKNQMRVQIKKRIAENAKKAMLALKNTTKKPQS